MTYLACHHYGLFLSLLLIVSGPILLGRSVTSGAAWLKLVTAVALSAAVIAPVAVAQLRARDAHQWQRDRVLVRLLSADSGDYTATPAQRIPLPDLAGKHRRDHFPLSPGWIVWLLATVGSAFGLWNRRFRRWTTACLTMLAGAWLLSLGSRFQIGEFVPYELLSRFYPGIAQVRSMFRFAVFVQLFAALLAAQGLSFFGTWWNSRAAWMSQRTRLWLVAAAVVPIALFGCAIAEIWPDPPTVRVVPETNAAWIGWLRDQTEADDAIVHVPFPEGATARDYESTTEWMYLQLEHDRPMVNGYSGFFPQRIRHLKEAMQKFPDRESLDALNAAGVRFCVVNREGRFHRMIRHDGLSPVFVDNGAGVVIYRLR